MNILYKNELANRLFCEKCNNVYKCTDGEEIKNDQFIECIEMSITV